MRMSAVEGEVIVIAGIGNGLLHELHRIVSARRRIHLVTVFGRDLGSAAQGHFAGVRVDALHEMMRHAVKGIVEHEVVKPLIVGGEGRHELIEVVLMHLARPDHGRFAGIGYVLEQARELVIGRGQAVVAVMIRIIVPVCGAGLAVYAVFARGSLLGAAGDEAAVAVVLVVGEVEHILLEEVFVVDDALERLIMRDTIIFAVIRLVEFLLLIGELILDGARVAELGEIGIFSADDIGDVREDGAVLRVQVIVVVNALGEIHRVTGERDLRHDLRADAARRVEHDLHAGLALFERDVFIQLFEAPCGSLHPFVAESAVVVGDVQLRPRRVDFLVYTSGGRSGAVAAGKTCGAGERHRYCERAAGKF